MKALVVGAGPKETFATWKLLRSPSLERLYCWPRSAAVPHATALNVADDASILEVARAIERARIDLVVLLSEDAVMSGLANVLQVYRIPCLGPTRVAAHFCWDAAFAEALLQRSGAAHIERRVSYTIEATETLARKKMRESGPVLVKASFAGQRLMEYECRTNRELLDAVEHMRQTGEELSVPPTTTLLAPITGRRCSYSCLVDGARAIAMGFVAEWQENVRGASDAFRAYGACSPVPWLNEASERTVMTDVVKPLLTALQEEGLHYTGWLSVDLIWHGDQPIIVDMHCSPSSLALEVLAVADTRDWLTLFKHMTRSAPVDASALVATEILPTVALTVGSREVRSTSGLVVGSMPPPPPMRAPTTTVSEHFSHAVESLVTDQVVSHESAGPLTVAAAGTDLAAARTTCFEHLMRLKQEERSGPRAAAVSRLVR